MTAETSDNKFQSWIKTLPRWKQIALFAVCLILTIAIFDAAKYKLDDSPRAKTIKQHIYPLQQQLDDSAKVGYILDQGRLSDGVSSLVSQYNELSEADREKFNASPLKNCLIAVFNLSDGIEEVALYKSWLSRDKYLAAMSSCK